MPAPRHRGTIRGFVFPSRIDCLGLDKRAYRIRSTRRTKAVPISEATGKLRAVRILLGHTTIENADRYLGVDVDDALTLPASRDLRGAAVSVRMAAECIRTVADDEIIAYWAVMLDTLAPIAARAAATLIERGETIAVADGATGGLISAGLLTVPGATRFCLGGGVIYSFKGRDVLLGLSREDLAGMEAVTESYALLQARAIRDRFGADWGIAESGSAGPGKHPRGAPTGKSCVGLAGPGIAVATTFESGSEDRLRNMGAFALAALHFLNSVLDVPPIKKVAG